MKTLNSLWIKLKNKGGGGQVITANTYQWKNIVSTSEIIELNKIVWLE